jgi:hypothetical protein
VGSKASSREEMVGCKDGAGEDMRGVVSEGILADADDVLLGSEDAVRVVRWRSILWGVQWHREAV